jgi:hypothetical protein|tara:strand:- start:1200 stop:1373 length:174 start_codon:yes stop_codon:yes gene_type:complete
MKKNPAENFTTIEIDPVTGNYFTIIPEWMVNEKGWYEGTEINLKMEDDEIFITERDD